MRPTRLVLASVLVCLFTAAPAAAAPLPAVQATVETPPNFDDKPGGKANADDPAIWVHPQLPEASLILGTLKQGGLDVYDLRGQRLQHVAAPPAPAGDGHAPGRFNNVDLVHGLWTARGRIDVAVVTDRGRDQLRIYAIDAAAAAAGGAPLTDVTAPDGPYIFSRDQTEVDTQTTAYGLATTRLADGAVAFAFVSQRHRTRMANVALWANPDGTVGYRVVGTFALPDRFTLPGGDAWTPCQGGDGEQAQVEGMVIDQDAQVLYMAQEKVGIWRLPLWRLFAAPRLVDRVREFGVPYERVWSDADEEYTCTLRWDRNPGVGGQHLSADVEGLTIVDRGRGRGYLVASSSSRGTRSPPPSACTAHRRNLALGI